MVKSKLVKDYDWKTIQTYYDLGHSWRDLIKEFNLTSKSLSKAVKNGWFITRTAGQSMKITLKMKPRKHSEQRKQLMADYARKRELGGSRNSNRFLYTTVDGHIVRLDSSYEVIVAEELDKNQIVWSRPGKFPWIDDEGIIHKYTPDFYLPQYDVYLDPKHKGLIPLHKDKILKVSEQNNIKVYILEENQLTWESIFSIINT